MKSKNFLILLILLTTGFVNASSVNLDWISPTSNINVSQNSFFNVIINASCSGGNCGEVNVSLDPSSGQGNTTYVVINYDNHYFDYNCTSNHHSGVDDGTNTINTGLGFDFPWFNTTKNNGTVIYMTTNGFLSWSSSVPSYIPTDTIMKTYEIISGNHQDLGGVGYNHEYWCLNQGTSPNKYAVFSWDSQWYNGGGVAQIKIILHENGNIEINYGTITDHVDVWTRGISRGNNIDYNYEINSSISSSMSNKGWIYSRSQSSAKGGLISMNSSTTPFYTNITNPYNLTLNENESKIIIWTVNATGNISEYEFFVYANLTSNLSISNITYKLNVTIKDTTLPVINITYPLNITYATKITALNYTYSDFNGGGSCWYSKDGGVNNSTKLSAGINFTDIDSIEGNNIWTVYCNDSSGNENSNSILFISDPPSINLTLLSPTENINVTQNEFFEVRARVSCSDNDCGEINVTLDPSGAIYNFTNCGQTGRTGPNQTQCNADYSGTSLDGLVTVVNGVQNWTVPATGTYVIEATGGAGGNTSSNGGYLGGYPAKMIGTFNLTQGQILQIVVGQKGGLGAHTSSSDYIANDYDNAGGGGGGGTFVYYNNFGAGGIYPLIAAGGGGGAESTNKGINATIIENGTASIAGGVAGSGGVNGSNGSVGGWSSGNWHGGAGAGWKSRFIYRLGSTHGESGYSYEGNWSGGQAGLMNAYAVGGFGGGGGASEDNGAAGGGGGYSGGGASQTSGNAAGGGGGSYNQGGNQSNSISTKSTDGYVTITYSGGKGGTVSMDPTATPFYTNNTNPYNLTLNEGQSATISWWVNATGEENETYEFYVYANKSSDSSIGDLTAKWNVTILENGTYVSGIDESAPTITFNSPWDNSFSSNTELDISLTISDPNLDSCWYTYDSIGTYISLGTGGSCSDITDLTWISGQHTVIIFANDTGGYEGNSSVHFIIDTTNPVINYKSETDTDNSKISRNNIYTDVEVTEVNEANITFNLYYLNETSVNKTTFYNQKRNINWTSLSDGSYKFNVTIYDNASNSASTSTRTIILDSTKPLINIISPSVVTYTSSSIDFDISSNENLSYCLVSINNWETNYTMILNSSLTGARYTLEDIADGSFTAKFSCNDSAGNTNNTKNVSFTIDTINPVVNINSPIDNGYFNYNTSISINYTISTEDINSCWYSVDEEENQTISGCSNITLNFSEGNHLVRIWVNDSANLKGNDNVNLTIDLTKPSINLISPLNNELNSSANWIDFYYNISDANSISNCSLVINGDANSTASNPEKEQTNNITVYLLNGEYEWKINCTDVSNNFNVSETRNLTINYTVIVDAQIFDGETTNFSNLTFEGRMNASHTTTITNLILENTSFGKIIFLENVDLSQDVENLVVNLSKYVNISQNKIDVNSSSLTGLNQNARLYLYNLSFINPQVLKNEEVCGDCVEESYSNGTLVFTVTGFSFYSTRETPLSSSPANGGGSNSGSGGNVYECKKNTDCNEGYTCFNHSCVKLFDVEILGVEPAIDSLSFELKYFIKGMAEIEGDVVIDFWMENENKRIELGRDTIYIGSFEEKTKITKLNLPYDVLEEDYDLYVRVTYEKYQAESFRKINIKIPEEVKKEIELMKAPITGKKDRSLYFYLFWIVIFGVSLFIFSFLRRYHGLFYLYTKGFIERMKLKARFALGHNRTQNLHNKIVKTRFIKGYPCIGSLTGKLVYSSNGKRIGRIEQAILEGNKIDSWIVKLDKEYRIRKKIRIKQESMKMIKDIFMVNGRIDKYLEKRNFEKEVENTEKNISILDRLMKILMDFGFVRHDLKNAVKLV